MISKFCEGCGASYEQNFFLVVRGHTGPTKGSVGFCVNLVPADEVVHTHERSLAHSKECAEKFISQYWKDWASSI